MLIASGQVGTTAYKGNASPIFIWSTQTRRTVTTLRGLSHRVNAVEFSTDEKFICGVGEVSNFLLGFIRLISIG